MQHLQIVSSSTVLVVPYMTRSGSGLGGGGGEGREG